MSALSELLDKDNWSNFAWYGERSLSLEVVPELAQDFAQLRADVETWKKYYYDVADAITSGSTSPTDLCNQARQLHAEMDKTDEVHREHVDTLLAELAQLRAELDKKDAALDGAEKAVRGAMNELGVPQPGYIAPVANAHAILLEWWQGYIAAHPKEGE